mmetsp:Transcript_16890/g.52782  ORF Transcript_16890/g.52782 Transcript_16890/m.52782 type:complete len:90 (+) Transcript_16890:1322-1591(+)
MSIHEGPPAPHPTTSLRGVFALEYAPREAGGTPRFSVPFPPSPLPTVVRKLRRPPLRLLEARLDFPPAGRTFARRVARALDRERPLIWP